MHLLAQKGIWMYRPAIYIYNVKNKSSQQKSYKFTNMF